MIHYFFEKIKLDNDLIDMLVKLVLVTYLISALHSTLSASSLTDMDVYAFPVNLIEQEVIIRVTTDAFPDENEWSLIDGNSYEIIYSTAGRVHQPLTSYQDTIHVEEGRCLRFIITDRGGDGFSKDGSFELILDGAEIISGSAFQSMKDHPFNCSEGLICEEAIPLNDGSELLKRAPNTWFVIRPVHDTYYSMQTITSCDTKIWLYDDCGKDHPTDQTGAILFNDDLENTQAGFVRVLLSGGTVYYVRVGNDDSCDEVSTFYLLDLQLKEGCMDPTACNFDPLANLDGGNCTYDNCNPDLSINKEILTSSIYLDSINNDSECLITEGCLRGYGKRYIIRFSTQIDNIGNADYIVGPPEEESPLFSEDNCHNHWHYLGYAEYLLFDTNGSAQPASFKNGFCALDFRCEESNSYKYDCNYMGISAGCYDIYEHDLLCQWIDVTDVEDGIYTLVVRVNYNRSPDIFNRTEADFENNWAQVCVKLDRTSGILKLEMFDECPVFTDCLGIEYGSTRIDCDGICGGNGHFGDIDENGKVDSLDLVELEKKLKDGSEFYMPCYDLDGSTDISIYDLVLLSNCLLNNPYQESDPLHVHCDFPTSIYNLNDSVFLSLSEYNRTDNYIQLDYVSNTDLKALDFEISGIHIDSVVTNINGLDLNSIMLSDRLVLYLLDTSQSINKSAISQPLARLYISGESAIETCLGIPYNAINVLNERIFLGMDISCIDLRATSAFNYDVLEHSGIYPNPAHDELIYSAKGINGPVKMVIFDQNGHQFVRSERSIDGAVKMDISELSRGIYFIKIDDPGYTEVRRLVKL